MEKIENIPDVKCGAWVGLTGENIDISKISE